MGKGDPWPIRRGLIANPVLVKDIRLFARHYRSISFPSKFIYFLLVLLTFLLLYGLGSGKLWHFYQSAGIVNTFLGMYVIDFLFQMPALSFLPVALSLWIVTMPLHWMFYGVDGAQDRFAFLRSSALHSLDITYGKLPNTFPAIIVLLITSISYIQGGCYNIHWPGVRYGQLHNAPQYGAPNIIPTVQEIIILFVVCSVCATLAYFISAFLVTLGSNDFVRYGLLIVFWFLNVGMSVIVFGPDLLFNWEINILSAITQSTMPLSVLEFTRYYCIDDATIRRMLKEDSNGFPLQLSFLAVVLTIQFMLIAIAIYGVNWNVKRRLAGWPGPKDLAKAAKAEEKRAQSI